MGDWTAEGVAEWGFSSLTQYESDMNDTKDVFSNRLGFVGLSHDQFGSVVLGKNWSVAYDVTSWTDAMAIRTSSSMGIYDGQTGTNGGHVDGSARADDALQYRVSFGGLNVGVQYQFNDKVETKVMGQTIASSERKKGESIAVSYDLPMGLSFGATYSETKYEHGALDQGVVDFAGNKSRSRTIGAKFANDDLTVAAAFGKFNNKTSLDGRIDDKSKGFELFGEYGLTQDLALQASYEQLTADKQTGDDSKAKDKIFAIAPVYTTGPMQFAFEWKHTREKGFDGKKDKDDAYTIQARYYF